MNEYAQCHACGYVGRAEDFPTKSTGPADWEQCPECDSSAVSLLENDPDAKILAARNSLRTYASIGAAVTDLAATIGENEKTARRLVARAARTEIANAFDLDADEVSRLFRMGVTVK